MANPVLACSPVSLQEPPDALRRTLLGDDDVQALCQSRDILADQVEAIPDVWYGFVGFPRPSCWQLQASRGPVTRRLPIWAPCASALQWILDTADAHFDQARLDYQHDRPAPRARQEEQDRRVCRARPWCRCAYLSALTVPVTTTLKPFWPERRLGGRRK